MVDDKGVVVSCNTFRSTPLRMQLAEEACASIHAARACIVDKNRRLEQTAIILLDMRDDAKNSQVLINATSK